MAIVMETEETPEPDTKPRPLAVGANTRRIMMCGREDGPIDLSLEMARVAAEAERIVGVRLLVLAFFGRTMTDDT